MKHAPARRCSDCPKRTKAVCRHAFGVFWCIKSCDGEGCAHPLDGVAEAWSKAVERMGARSCKSVPVDLSVVETPRLATHGDVRVKMSSRKTTFIQLDLIAAEEPPPLTDSDY